jgi:hypothetical protein
MFAGELHQLHRESGARIKRVRVNYFVRDGDFRFNCDSE